MKKNKSGNGCCMMNRREFGVLTAMGAAGAALPFGRAKALPLPAAGPERKVALSGVARGSAEEVMAKAVRRAAEAATDFSWLSKGDSVFIKPVVNSGNIYPATTSPSGLKAMVKLLKEKGAGKVVVCDMSGIEHVKLAEKGLKKGSTRELMRNCGLLQAAEEAGAELHLPEEQGWDAFFEDGPAPGSHFKAGIMIPSILKEMDHIVLLPRTSRHIIAGSTLGLKAAVGYLRTDSRLEYHRDAASFYEKTAEINTLPTLKDKLRLTLTVADKVLTTFGPDDGYVRTPDTGLVIASESIVAHDMASLAWLLINRELTPDSEKGGLFDPYPSGTNMANKGVVVWLGGVREAARAETLSSPEIRTIWDDKVLNRAYHLWGGVPKVSLEDSSGNVPDKLMADLAGRTAMPA